MKKINYDENKIILTNNYFNFMLNIEGIDEYICINPFTNVSDIFNFKNKNYFNTYFIDAYGEKLLDIINIDLVNNFCNNINNMLNFNLMSSNLDVEKNVKNFFEINKDIKINKDNLHSILNIIDKYSDKNIKVIVYGFNGLKISDYTFPKLNILYLIQDLINNITFDELEMLVLDNKNDFIEIIDVNVLISYIEAETQVFIDKKKISDYLNGILNFDTFLIDNILKKISFF